MEVNIKDLQPYLESLSDKQKDKLIIQLLKKDKLLMEKLYFKHMASPQEYDQLYEDFKTQIAQKFNTSYRAHSQELANAKAINEAKRVIDHFTKIDKDPIKEAEMLLMILNVVLNQSDANLGTCWTKYDLTVTQTIRRLITVICNKIHEDHLLDFKPKVDKYLKLLKSHSNFNDFVWDLPDEL